MDENNNVVDTTAEQPSAPQEPANNQAQQPQYTAAPQQPYAQPQQPYAQPQQPYAQMPQTYDSGSFGWGVLGFFFPLIGFILFFVWMNSKPLSGKKALIGAIIGVVCYILLWVAVFAFVGMAASSSYYYY